MKRSRSRARGGYKSVYWALRQMFASGQDGFLYDYSNISSLNQLSTGTTPVAVVTDPAGLTMDSRFGMALGPELVDTINTAAAWTASGTNTVVDDAGAVKITYVDNAAGAVALFSAAAGLSLNLTVGANYKITYEIKVNSGSANAAVVNAATNQSVAVTSTSFITQEFVFNASNATTNNFTFANMSAGEIVWIKNISVKLLDGNHAIQATAGARPTWTNLVNMALQSNALTTSPWATAGTGTVLQNAVGLTGAANEAWTITDSDAAVAYNTHQDITLIAANYTAQVAVKKTVGAQSTYPLVWATSQGGSSRIAVVTIDTSNGVATIWSAYTGFTVIPGYSATCVSHPQNSGYWLVTFTFLATAETYRFNLLPAGTANATQSTGAVDATKQGSAIFQNFQVNFGTTAERYQSITTAASFDTAGFPYYLSFPGTPVNLTSATGGGGSAGFFWCGVVQFTGGAGTLQTLIADNGTNTGYKVQKDTSDKLSFSAGNNVAFTTKASTAALSVGTKYMLTVRDNGTNLSVQIGSAAPETVARPVVVAGTAGYTLCKDNGAASSFAIVNQYPPVYFKDTGLTDAQVAAVQAFVSAMAGL